MFLLQLCTEHDNDELAFHGSFTDRQAARCANMRDVNCAIGQITTSQNAYTFNYVGHVHALHVIYPAIEREPTFTSALQPPTSTECLCYIILQDYPAFKNLRPYHKQLECNKSAAYCRKAY